VRIICHSLGCLSVPAAHVQQALDHDENGWQTVASLTSNCLKGGHTGNGISELTQGRKNLYK
jgi:hypothetical protein